MNLRVTIKGIDDKASLIQETNEKVASALERFEDRVLDISVLLEDETGPNKNTVDKRCRINVHLKGGDEITIDEVGEEILSSLNVALGRLKAAMSRAVGKAKRGVGAG